MDGNPPCCVQCKQVIPKKAKNHRGLDKKALTLKLRRTNVTVYDVLKFVYLYEGPCDGHVCGSCYLHMEKEHREIYAQTKQPFKVTRKSRQKAANTSNKRKQRTPGSTPTKKRQKNSSSCEFQPLASSTPQRPRRTLFPDGKKSREKPSKTQTRATLNQISESLKKARYETALRQILSRSPLARDAFEQIVQQRVRREMSSFLSKSHKYAGLVETVGMLQSFSWTQVIEDAAREMPTFLSAIRGSICRNSQATKVTRKSEVEQPRIGMMLSIPMYHHRPVTYKLPQAACSAQMWTSGASEKLYKSLNHLAVCQSASATRKLVQKLCDEPDQEMAVLKEQLEQECRTLDEAPMNTTLDLLLDGNLESEDESDNDYRLPSDGEESVADGNDSVASLDLDPEPEPLPLVPVRGFAVVWDNIQKLSQVRDSYSGNKNEMLLWANAFAAVNRVEPDPELTANNNTLNAADLPTATFLPTVADAANLRERCMCIASRIIVQHMDHFKVNYSDVVTWHIPHEHQQEMAEKSKVINIGIIDENPSTRSGTIGIMQNLQERVPQHEDGTYRTVLCHGDGGSMERMNDGKNARSADPTPTDRLEGLEQVPQEFHHRGLMLTDTLDVTLKFNSIGDRCTLAQLRNEFDHTAVSANAMQCYNAAENLLRFTTEAHVVYLAMRLLELTSPHGAPKGSPISASAASRRQYLDDLCRKIVDEIWLLPSSEDVDEVTDAEAPEFAGDWCICEADTEIDGVMVRCSNQQCHIGGWFHPECVNLEPANMPGRGTDWWCSQDCKDTGSSILCACKKIKEDEMIRCSAGERCTSGDFFHLGCMGLETKPGGPWYCSNECQSIEPDYKRNYAIALTWFGLLDMVHRDTIREGDGPGMMMMWRINMTRFWPRNHYKYLIIGHRLLAGINGWLQPRLIEEVLHNRTCNMRGGPGHNIAMDRVNEFLNNQFKDILQHSQGNYTDDTVHRAGRMVGSVAKAIDAVFSIQVAETTLDQSYRKQHDYQADIERFVADYWEDDLFAMIPGRQHASFPQFAVQTNIQDPVKLKQRLQRYSKKLDKTREVME